jgi:hypothetical protein
MAMKGLGVVLAAFGVCVFAVTLAVLLATIVSSEAVLEWLTATPPCGGPANKPFRSGLFTEVPGEPV